MKITPAQLKVLLIGSNLISDKHFNDALKKVIKIGGKQENLKAKLIGGAKMFRFLSGDDHGVGFRNAEAAQKQLLILGIPIESDDIGGAVGRSAEFNIENGLVQITTVI